jgi:hypothetical protein
MAPSHSAAAVAGVQLVSRQHSSLVPFFHTMPSVERQLSTVLACAKATTGAASAADANSIATLFSFFIDSPLEESRRCLRNVQSIRRENRAKPCGHGHSPPWTIVP